MMGAAAPQYTANKLPAVVAATAPRGAVCVYAAAGGGGQLHNGSATTTSDAEQQEQQDPFVIHLPATDGVADAMPRAATDPATAGLPGTPTGSMVAVDAHGLALWQSAPAGSQAGSALSCQGSSSSKALAAMQQEPPRNALQPKPAAGPLGLLSWSSRDSTWWVGGPIGGTLCVNPPLPPSGDDGTATSAALQAALPSALQRRAAAGAPARSANPLAILPVLQQHGKGGSLQHWGSPIGGTLYINPQAPLDWPKGSTWGSSSRSGSGGGGSGAGRRAGGPSAPPSAAAAAAAAAGRAGTGAGVPPGLGIARAGVALMTAVAAAALAMYGSRDKQPPRAVPTTTATTTTTTAAPAAAAGLGGGVLARAGSGSATAAAGAEEGADPAGGPLYHEWMVARLSSALAGFEAEQAMLRTELAVLAAHPAGRGGASGSAQGLWRALRGLFAGDSSSSVAPADAVAPGAAGDAALSVADVSARAGELREQLESLAILQAALSAELAEQQQLLQQAREHERQQVAAATSSSR
jgi:hypothetical protein